MERRIEGIYKSHYHHQVGAAFKVINIFPNGINLGDKMSPFYMVDYNPKTSIQPTDKALGVEQHPHRGIEPVTLLFQGALAHSDSAGHQGILREGDVQWMTAGKGILHKEFIAPELSKNGGTLEMIQLWTILPKAFKYVEPSYQHLNKKDIKEVVLSDQKSKVRVIAGEYQGVESGTKTYSKLKLLDVYLSHDGEFTINVDPTDNVGIVFMDGEALVNNTQVLEQEFVLFANENNEIKIKAVKESHFLVLSGTPLNEPAVHHGPFVMNTKEEIYQALEDAKAGVFGRME